MISYLESVVIQVQEGVPGVENRSRHPFVGIQLSFTVHESLVSTLHMHVLKLLGPTRKQIHPPTLTHKSSHRVVEFGDQECGRAEMRLIQSVGESLRVSHKYCLFLGV